MGSKAGPSASVNFFDDNFEETVTNWFNECNSDGSDIDDYVDDDFCIQSEHETESEQSECSGDENDVPDAEPTANDQHQYYFGKNRFKWSASEVVPRRGRTLRHNIVLQPPGLKQVSRELGTSARPIDVWNLLFNEHMVEQVVQ
nr:unnamed protein product [Callosobruchus analis]